MRLSDLGLSPATQACLRKANIRNVRDLLDHSCRELTWHCEVGGAELYEIVCQLARHQLVLRPTPTRTTNFPTERDLEIFRLRVVEGLSLPQAGSKVGISSERVRQILNRNFGVTGKPPAVKERRS